MRILIVEDDDRIAKPLIEDLKYQGYIVDYVRDGAQGWEYIQAANYDLILLDVMLPKVDGIELCRRLRSANFSTPILMLTARDTTRDKVLGLDAGSDDYLIKPFELEELSARIRALARRSPEIKPCLLSHGDLQLNPATHTAKYGDIPLVLTPREYEILECFLQSPKLVLTRSQIIEKLWKFDSNSGEETVKTHITNLRKKLKAVGAREDFIETVYGIGYRLCQL